MKIKGFSDELEKTIERISKKFGFHCDFNLLEIKKTENNILVVSYDGNMAKIETNEISSVLKRYWNSRAGVV